ncbi:MAG: DUF2064 domain-containing protein [Acidobacteria bacterium]|nr:DUF2064 domain-containing protein [Acidobacteriota bacterium]
MGTDVPALGAALVVQALERLESADVVLGPAEDGGYYLMALSRPHPEIFRDVPWSTADVLGATLERARHAGLRPEDVDLGRDASHEPRLGHRELLGRGQGLLRFDGQLVESNRHEC